MHRFVTCHLFSVLATDVIGKLHLQPRLGRAAECFCQPNGHFRADTGLAVDDVVERLPRDSEQLCPVSDG